MKTPLSLLLFGGLIMVTTGCSGSKNIMGALTYQPWVLNSIMGKAVDESNYMDRLPSLSFQDNGKVAGFTGCNNFNGNFKLDGTNMAIDPGAMTRKMCPGNGEQDFLDAISQVKNVSLDKDKLSMSNGATELLTFSRFGGK